MKAPKLVFPQDNPVHPHRREGGIDLLDLLTGCALIGILGLPEEFSNQECAQSAVAYAVETLAELEKFRNDPEKYPLSRGD